MTDLITTIIPTYQRPSLLKKAIQSVLRQTYPHFQLCIYDNASSDSTADVVAAFAKEDPRVKYFCHARNVGAVQNFQYGLSRVETPFFSFLSDDDFLLPEFYKTALTALRKYPEATFFYGAVIDVNDESEAVDIALCKWPKKEYYSPPEGLLEMIGKYSNWAGAFFRREVIAKVGQLDLNLKAIDMDYMLRAAAICSFTISKKPCAIFLQHPSSYSGANGLKLIWPGWPMMMHKLNQSPFLSAQTKKMALHKLQRDFHKLLLMNALRCLEKRKFRDAESIAQIFSQKCSRRGVGMFLLIVIKMCKAVTFIPTLILLLLKGRRFWRRRMRGAFMQTECEKWVNFL
jgi:glycosyltransferase involved in cell wall biosynthesis